MLLAGPGGLSASPAEAGVVLPTDSIYKDLLLPLLPFMLLGKQPTMPSILLYKQPRQHWEALMGLCHLALELSVIVSMISAQCWRLLVNLLATTSRAY